MSGGAYEYAYLRVVEFADALDDNRTLDGYQLARPNGLDRLAFAAHLRKVADAMKAIEWVDSGDCESPHDVEAIHAVTGV
jgi:hypothetical protein